MTRTTNARIAGFTFLFYIATGIAGRVLFDQATTGEGIAAKLAGIAQHATGVRVTIVLTLLTCFAALVLGVTLYRITREQDPGEPSPAARRIPARPGRAVYVVTHGRVRADARAVAAHQRRRHAGTISTKRSTMRGAGQRGGAMRS